MATAPIVWAALLALAVNVTGAPVSKWAAKAIHLVGSASVPVMLLVLGIQPSRLSLVEGRRTSAAATAIKLVAAAILAVGVAARWACRELSGTRESCKPAHQLLFRQSSDGGVRLGAWASYRSGVCVDGFERRQPDLLLAWMR